MLSIEGLKQLAIISFSSAGSWHVLLNKFLFSAAHNNMPFSPLPRPEPADLLEWHGRRVLTEESSTVRRGGCGPDKPNRTKFQSQFYCRGRFSLSVTLVGEGWNWDVQARRRVWCILCSITQILFMDREELSLLWVVQSLGLRGQGEEAGDFFCQRTRGLCLWMLLFFCYCKKEPLILLGYQ